MSSVDVVVDVNEAGIVTMLDDVKREICQILEFCLASPSRLEKKLQLYSNLESSVHIQLSSAKIEGRGNREEKILAFKQKG